MLLVLRVCGLLWIIIIRLWRLQILICNSIYVLYLWTIGTAINHIIYASAALNFLALLGLLYTVFKRCG